MTAVNTEAPVKGTRRAAAPDALLAELSEALRRVRRGELDVRLARRRPGRWKDLTEAVNLMAANLTAQVRGIAQVATAVARGDLSQKITVDARGEILELKPVWLYHGVAQRRGDAAGAVRG